MDFKDRLKELRLDKGMSQAVLAKRLGLSKSRISMYEIGEREPDFETLELIADFFNVDIDYLLGKKDVSTYVISKEDAAFLEMYRKLSPNEQQLVAEMTKTLLKKS